MGLCFAWFKYISISKFEPSSGTNYSIEGILGLYSKTNSLHLYIKKNTIYPVGQILLFVSQFIYIFLTVGLIPYFTGDDKDINLIYNLMVINFGILFFVFAVSYISRKWGVWNIPIPTLNSSPESYGLMMVGIVEMAVSYVLGHWFIFGFSVAVLVAGWFIR